MRARPRAPRPACRLPSAARRRAITTAAASPAGFWGSGPRTFQVVDTHCEGEPARIVVGGMPTVPGATMFDKRNHMMEHMDELRTLLITEPRGYPCQNADVILPPTLEEAAYGFVSATGRLPPRRCRA